MGQVCIQERTQVIFGVGLLPPSEILFHHHTTSQPPVRHSMEVHIALWPAGDVTVELFDDSTVETLHKAVASESGIDNDIPFALRITEGGCAGQVVEDIRMLGDGDRIAVDLSEAQMAQLRKLHTEALTQLMHNSHECVDTARALLRAGAEPCRPAFCRAATNGWLHMCELLLDAGAHQPHQECRRPNNCFMSAALGSGSTELCHMLWERLGLSPLSHMHCDLQYNNYVKIDTAVAVEGLNIEKLKAMFWINCNVVNYLAGEGGEFLTQHFGGEFLARSALRTFLRHGMQAEPEPLARHVTSEMWNPKEADTDFITMLLEHGADPSGEDETLFVWALRLPTLEAADAVLDIYPDMEVASPDGAGRNALHHLVMFFAVQGRSPDFILDGLLEKLADRADPASLCAADAEGKTPLHLALELPRHSNRLVFSRFVRHLAPLMLRAGEGAVALRLLATHGERVECGRLASLGANLGEALLLAVQDNEVAACTVLLGLGAQCRVPHTRKQKKGAALSPQLRRLLQNYNGVVQQKATRCAGRPGWGDL
eukprot:TRINITY_DN3629_c0_g2_i3.p1 TRINITY_DN3629_c0_g2~~TRINITY_DN3629_c0_g2_i3.p1  ORF type:complete len:542 (+),score=124.61 TRINITY_DN3629_c0_g2_i3:52-1677(+)